MQKGKGKALRSFSLALFSLVLKQDSANRMEAYYTARHLWEEAGKRLKGQIKGQTEKKKSETLRFQTSQWKGATIWIFSRLLAPLLSFNS
jgi:hypothetical protein